MKHDQQSSAPISQGDIRILLQREFPCLDGQILLAIDQQHTCWVSVPTSCKILRLNIRGQLQRIARSKELVQAGQQLTLATKGGSQRITCLKVEQAVDWLAGMKASQPGAAATFLQQVTDAAALLREEAQSQ